MNMNKLTRHGFMAVALIAVAGCNEIAPGNTDNTAPEAVAGKDRYAPVGSSVQLDAGASSDDDGDTLTYRWSLTTQPFGSTVTLSDTTAATPTLVPDVAGQYLISLEVSDGQASSQADSLSLIAADWLLDTSERSSTITENATGVLVNVQNTSIETQDGVDLLTITTTGIPDYRVTLTQDDIFTLNNRPKASTDFTDGATSASAGDIIELGQNIGYKTTGPGCELGYWPPGPACPSNQSKAQSLPVEPEPAVTQCSTTIESIGLMLNGTSIYNWEDGQSYNNQKVWTNLAPVFEQYDVDICEGHAQQQGDYHHHMHSGCVQDMLDDTGDGHSPIYGFAADGYPIHGPYYLQGVLAQPSWVKREYMANSSTGCGFDGVRSCQLVDQYDLSKGTTTVNSGPSTAGTVATMSGNDIAAVSGVYFEDYYFDATLAAQNGAYLDEHNGHDHDGLGYHYHITAEAANGYLVPVFPYQVGPTFYGELPDGTFAICGQ